MDKKWWIFIILIVVLGGLGGLGYWFFVGNKNSNNENSGNYEANRTSAITNTDNTLSNNIYNNLENNTDGNTSLNEQNSVQNNQVILPAENSIETPVEEAPTPTPAPPVEEVISSFSTKIYSTDSARQNNISITCNALNGTIVKNGNTFSFCNTVGQSSTSKGYEKADIFDSDGNKKKGLGGGNCQISTTLYNAVLAVPNLVVTERHQHSNYVPYIKKGKDAAVAYGSYDLKFRNNYGTDIKINTSATASAVNVDIISIK